MKELAKIFVFTKDEDYLMKYWIPYHGELFGYTNLYILDHGSNKKTQKVFDQYRDKGINIINCSKVPFINKYRMLNQNMRQHQPYTKFLIPVDSDEFIAFDEGDTFSCKKDRVLDYLKKFKVSDNKIKFGAMLAIPKQESYDNSLLEIEDFVVFPAGTKSKSKSFFPSKYFIATDQGNHSGKVSGSNGRVLSNLTLLHFEIRSLEHAKEKAYRGAKAYGFMNSEKQPPVGRTWWAKLQIFKNGDPNKWYSDRIKKLESNTTTKTKEFSNYAKSLVN